MTKTSSARGHSNGSGGGGDGGDPYRPNLAHGSRFNAQRGDARAIGRPLGSLPTRPPPGGTPWDQTGPIESNQSGRGYSLRPRHDATLVNIINESKKQQITMAGASNGRKCHSHAPNLTLIPTKLPSNLS